MARLALKGAILKVVSINAEQTIDPKNIAFNVDEELTPEFVSKINYGVLKITGSGKVLQVQIPAESYTPFTAASVLSLNQKLQAIADDYAEAEAKRQLTLQSISQNTGLPLA